MDKVDKPFDGEKARQRTWTDEELIQLWKAAEQLDAYEASYVSFPPQTGRGLALTEAFTTLWVAISSPAVGTQSVGHKIRCT
jgi:hypothetical protein